MLLNRARAALVCRRIAGLVSRPATGTAAAGSTVWREAVLDADDISAAGYAALVNWAVRNADAVERLLFGPAGQVMCTCNVEWVSLCCGPCLSD